MTLALLFMTLKILVTDQGRQKYATIVRTPFTISKIISFPFIHFSSVKTSWTSGV